MTKRITLITGGSKGIGFQVARNLGKENNIVLVGARNESEGKKAVDALEKENIEAQLVVLDITNKESIEKAYTYINNNFGKLDTLVNNAAITLPEDNHASEVSLDTIRSIFETNFFAQIAITQTLLPLIRKSTAGRIVNVSSSLGSLSMQSTANYKLYGFNIFAYNASKTALNAFTVALAKELKGTSIKVNSADPDWCKTNIGGEYAPFLAEDGAQSITKLALLDENGPHGGFFNSSALLAW